MIQKQVHIAMEIIMILIGEKTVMKWQRTNFMYIFINFSTVNEIEIDQVNETNKNLFYHYLRIFNSFKSEKLIKQTILIPIIPIKTCLCLSLRILKGGLTSNSSLTALI